MHYINQCAVEKVGSDSFFGESVPAISYSMRFGLASCPPSSVDRSTSKRSLSVTRFLYTTRSISVARISQFPTSRFIPDPRPHLVPPRPVTSPLPTLVRPPPYANANNLFKVCIFHHVICSFANLLSVIVTLSYWLHVKPLPRYVARDQSVTHSPGINNLHKTYSLSLLFAEASLKSWHGTSGSLRNAYSITMSFAGNDG